MKKLMTIMMFSLLLLSLAKVHAAETPIYQQGGIPAIQQDDVQSREVEQLVDPMGRPRYEVKPQSALPSKDAEEQMIQGDQLQHGTPASGGLIDPSSQTGVTHDDFQWGEITNPEMEDMMDSNTFINFNGTTQVTGVDHCEKEELILIADTESLTALDKFQQELDEAWNSEMDVTKCFDFPEPIELKSTLNIVRANPQRRTNIKLVGMKFKATRLFASPMHGDVGGPLVRVVNEGGKLELIDLNIKAEDSDPQVDACLLIENSKDVVMQRGSLSHCKIGAIVMDSNSNHFGAYESKYVEADGVYIGKNFEKGILVQRSDKISFGYNRFDSNMKVENEEGALIFDYYNEIMLGNAANPGITKPTPMPFEGGEGDFSRLVIGGINQPRFLTFMFDNPPGSVQMYSTVADAVKFVGACELGEDKKCHAKVETQWHCPIGMKLTGVYTSPDSENTPEDESASSEFIEPFECSFFVVKPQEEFVMTTPDAGADVDVELEGGSGMTGMAAKKMCTLMANAPVAYTPLMWLFLSVGILGAVRICRGRRT